MASAFTREVIFEQYESRLYFQDFAVHQYSRGSRQLRLISVNVPRVRVSAKLFTGEAVPVAVKAFDKYEERPEDSDESYTRVDVESLPGKVIWEKEFSPGGAIDSEQTVALNWDEIVGAESRRRGPVYCGIDRSGERGREACRDAVVSPVD